jgi:glycosyltransferase involved in cell wall biosynthesis
MRVLFLTGIWPPDVGGPATHGPDFARFLRDRGHSVEVVTMSDAEPTDRPVPIHAVSRGRPFPIRYPDVALTGFRRGRKADVIYATATYAAAAAAARAARKPLVVKLVSDPAYERAWRLNLFRGAADEFESASDPRLATLRRLRTLTLRQATRIVVPSAYLANFASGWGLDESRIEVVVNPAPPPMDVVPADLGPCTFVYVGRLATQKGVDILLDAFAGVDGAQLEIVGDGPERATLEARADPRVRFLGALPRDQVLAHLAGARAAVLASVWENLPHAAVEALSVGTPVVSTAVGGVPEVVHDGENGLLVPARDVVALRDALRTVATDDALRARLAAGAKPSVAEIGQEAIYGKLERTLLEVVE